MKSARTVLLGIAIAAAAMAMVGCRSVDEDELRTLVAGEVDARLAQTGGTTDIGLSLGEGRRDLASLTQDVDALALSLAELRGALYGPKTPSAAKHDTLASIDSRMDEIELLLYGRTHPPLQGSETWQLLSRFSTVERQVDDIQTQLDELEQRMADLTFLMEDFVEAAELEARAECRRRQIEDHGSYSGC